MVKKMLAALLALGIIGGVSAAENDGAFSREGRQRTEMRGSRGRRNGRGDRGFGSQMMRMNPFARFKAEEEIRQKFPKELEEAQKQLIEAEKKIAELAKKAKVDLPESYEGKLRQLQAKQPAEFGKLVAEENPRKAMAGIRELAKANGIEFGGMNAPRRGGRPEFGREGAREDAPRRSGRVDMNKLRRMYPEEMAKLDELRKSDPEAFRNGLRELVRKSKDNKPVKEPEK